jgi:hypothetical protein
MRAGNLAILGLDVMRTVVRRENEDRIIRQSCGGSRAEPSRRQQPRLAEITATVLWRSCNRRRYRLNIAICASRGRAGIRSAALF